MTRTSKALLLALGRLANIGLVLAMAAALARLLPRATYGSFRQLLDTYSMTSALLAAGLPDSIYYFFPRYHAADRRLFMTQTLGLMALQGGLLSLVFYLGAEAIGSFYHNGALPELLHAFSPYPLFMVPFLATESALMSVDRPLAAMSFGVASRTISFCSMVVPTWLGAPVVTGIHFWVSSAALLALASVMIMLRTAGGARIGFSPSILRAQVRFSFPIFLASGLFLMTIYIDKMVVGRLCGPLVYAAYASGAMELPFSTIVSGSVSTVLFPEMVRLMQSDRRRELVDLFQRATRSCNVVLLPFFGLLMVFAPEVMTILYSPSLADAAPFFRVYLLLVPMRVVMYAQLTFSLNANWIYTRGAIISAVIAATVCTMGVRLTGAPIWAAVGSVAALWAAFLYASHHLSRVMRIRTREFLPLRHWAATIAVSLGCGAAAWSATRGLRAASTPGCLVRLAVGTAIFVVLYVTLTTVLKLARWREILAALRPRPPVSAMTPAHPAEVGGGEN